MVLDPLAAQVLGIVTVKTVPIVLDYLTERLKAVRKNRQEKRNSEVRALQNEILKLKKQLASKERVDEPDVTRVALQLEKVRAVQEQQGLELISDQTMKQWIMERFEGLGETNERASFHINIWTRKGAGSVAQDIVIAPTSQSPEYVIGEKIIFLFRSDKDCFLTLFNLGTTGKITVLFPNRLVQDNYIEADKTYSIPGEGYPFDYVLAGPPGTETIKAVASLERAEMVDSDIRQIDNVFYSSEKSAAAKDIQIVQKRMKESPDSHWAIADYSFTVR